MVNITLTDTENQILNQKVREEIAGSLGVKPELLHYIPELLADLWALGSSPQLIVGLLRPLGLIPKHTRVLDLGCGKGAVAITVANELGFRVLGVDGFQPFIQTARELSKENGASSLCRFKCKDLHSVLKDSEDFDVVIYVGVGGVLGRLDECVGKLRESIHPKGYVIIEDGFLRQSDRIKPYGYEHCASHEETLRFLVDHGDTLLQEVIVTPDELRAFNDRNTELIRRRARQLSEKHPGIAHLFFEYVESQEREADVLETEIGIGVWLIQKV